MHIFFFTLAALLGLETAHAVPAGQPSNTPTCTYTCPPRDNAGFPLGTHNNDGTTLFCSYPAFAGENPNDFFCKYSLATGAITQDEDVGYCSSTAVLSCSPSRRRSAIPQAPAPPKAAPVARAPTSNKMTVMAKVKKRQPAQTEA